ncbi:MAG: adenylosuccinate synthetase, partial [Sinomicrobium sp.]|nr:adenylosuccinate synthetase [Sinomicrobium sp.]
RVCDLADKALLDTKLDRMLHHHNALLKGWGAEPVEKKELLDALLEVAPKILPFMEPVWKRLDTLRREGKRILFEGAQGVMLDVDHGTYPFVTSSNTVPGMAAIGSGSSLHAVNYILGITKAYTTRVGSGPFPTELFDETGETIGRVGKEFGATTGRKRRCGWLDLVALRYAVRINGVTKLMMMKADVLSGFKTVNVCTAYQYNGKTITHLPYSIAPEHLHPVYTELKGWEQQLSGITAASGLPETLRQYIAFLETALGVPVTIVSVGPDRTQTIHC